jgi:NAD(P)-dependent dehydrogenase (short-subunit alcohol dehydrogenase family)
VTRFIHLNEGRHMDLKLEGKTALVTGASKGIGLAVVRALTAEGATVVAGARTPTPELRAATPHALAVDLATPYGPAQLVEHALSELGGIDLLVNNVGANPAPVGGFLTVSDDDWRRVLDVNVMSAVRATRTALPSLIERRGAIVGIGSLNARIAQPAVVAYAAAKAAFVNLGKALAEEFGPQGVRVNTILPGPVRTEMWTAPGGPGAAMAAHFGMTPDELIEQLPGMAGMTTGRFAEPDEVAALVLLLASEAVPSVTGTSVVIDGGLMKAA